ncbi:MAG: uroporphyrinogen III methyltransferase/synthase [Hyphomicrobiaceae bacterium]
MSTPGSKQGRVFLVGAGPGDPGLVTVRAREVLERADVVLYDALANGGLLDYAPITAERVLVGKRHGRVTLAQSETEALLLHHAAQGRTVVRLKGGDPFVFGRGGEEAEACRRAGVDFEVVPGITSAIAVPAYAGIPLTHREHSSLVTFVTGYPGNANAQGEPNWELLAQTGGTLVLMMAMTRMAEISESLIKGGMDPATPAAAVRWGTLPSQRKVIGTLADIADRATNELGRPPVIFVVGAVAALGRELDWYERRPLFGRRIVVTRARAQASALATRLEELGAEVVAFPTIEVRPVAVDAPALDRVAGSDLLVLTSANGVERFFECWLQAERDIRDLAGVRLATIGPVTAAAVARRGLKVAVQAQDYRAEGLLEALGDVDGLKVVVARAEVAREILPDTLRQRGASVEVLPLYRTTVPEPAPDPAELANVDAVTFTSSSTVTNFLALVGENWRESLRDTCVAAIGPVTAETLADAGRPADVVAEKSTIDGLVDALLSSLAPA